MAIVGKEKYKDNIKVTGFALEYKVSKLLQDSKWTVINNRYYLDDVTEQVREIDLIAYKATEVKNTIVYNVLIISCKKSEKNLWAFLTKKYNFNDPNINFQPSLLWSNNKVLKELTSEKTWANDLNNKIKSESFYENIFKLNNQVFAFQEMDKSSGKVQNDKPIFDSISTLIKAYSYELNSLEKRRSDDCVYNFNLISIAETDFLELLFNVNDIDANEISEIKYLNRFIVNKGDDYFRVNFYTYDCFSTVLNDYNKLADWNNSFFDSIIDDFYVDIFNDKRRYFFKKEFDEAISWRIHNFLEHSQYIPNENICVADFVKKDNILLLEIYGIAEEAVVDMNKDKDLLKTTKNHLGKYYRYSGEIKFVYTELPF